MRALLADTGPLFALVDIDDKHHQRAQRELKHIDQEGYDLVVAFPVFQALRRSGHHPRGRPAVSAEQAP
jgi:predicted nucleic acid-binding protein